MSEKRKQDELSEQMLELIKPENHIDFKKLLVEYSFIMMDAGIRAYKTSLIH